jgi:hypothetical protein
LGGAHDINYGKHIVISRIASVGSPFRIEHPMIYLPTRQFLEAVQMWDVIPSLAVFIVGLVVIFLAVGENA